MTDETREQIKRDAKHASTSEEGDFSKRWHDGYIEGAIAQHPIAFSAGIQACLNKFNEVVKGKANTMHADSAIVIIYKELEKLKV